MNKIEEMIKKLCPNGVEYKELSELCDIKKGNQLNKEVLSSYGEYPVINGGINPSGYWNEYNTFEDTITISQGGASAGYINFIQSKFWAGAHCYTILNHKEIINYKFLYYILKKEENNLMLAKLGAGIPSINYKTLATLKIPVPPIAVQQEIVKVLDTFSELTAELTAELAARKKQYAYYKHKLLSFENLIDTKIEYYPLSEVCDFQNGFAFKSSFFKDSGYPILRITNISEGNKIGNNFVYFNKEDYKENLENFIVERSSIVIAMSGATTGKIGYNYSNTTYYLNQRVGKFIPNKKRLNNRFLFYWLQTQNKNISRISTASGSQPNLSSVELMKIKIPVPPLEIQEYIVNILDKFDSLVNDIMVGLPAEIAARQKQYAYYRDKLLTFASLK